MDGVIDPARDLFDRAENYLPTYLPYLDYTKQTKFRNPTVRQVGR